MTGVNEDFPTSPVVFQYPRDTWHELNFFKSYTFCESCMMTARFLVLIAVFFFPSQQSLAQQLGVAARRDSSNVPASRRSSGADFIPGFTHAPLISEVSTFVFSITTPFVVSPRTFLFCRGQHPCPSKGVISCSHGFRRYTGSFLYFPPSPVHEEG